jgi:hypothetical protein
MSYIEKTCLNPHVVDVLDAAFERVWAVYDAAFPVSDPAREDRRALVARVLMLEVDNGEMTVDALVRRAQPVTELALSFR